MADTIVVTQVETVELILMTGSKACAGNLCMIFLLSPKTRSRDSALTRETASSPREGQLCCTTEGFPDTAYKVRLWWSWALTGGRLCWRNGYQTLAV